MVAITYIDVSDTYTLKYGNETFTGLESLKEVGEKIKNLEKSEEENDGNNSKNNL